MMKVLPVLVALAALLMALPSQAQRWGGGYHASTAAEGYQRGYADVVRSAGAANLMNSEAMGNVEDARRKHIDNRLQATKTYFEMKRYNKEYRDATKKPRPTSEQLFRLAKEATAGGLSHADLDPVTGVINWPAVFKTDLYASDRKDLDALYADRANAGGKTDAEQHQEIRELIRKMRSDLARQVNDKDIAPQAFTQASSFLKKLEYTASHAG